MTVFFFAEPVKQQTGTNVQHPGKQLHEYQHQEARTPNQITINHLM